MKTSIKIFAYAVAASFALLACNDTIANNAARQNDSELPPKIQPNEVPAMDSRVVSYQRTWRGNEYRESLGYGSGFTADNDILKIWFPHIFNDGKTESECNYFALYFNTNSAPFDSYLTFSQDMKLYKRICTQKEESKFISEDFIFETMLICDDNAGTMRKNISLDSTRIYTVPDWDCGSDIGAPNREEVYF